MLSNYVMRTAILSGALLLGSLTPALAQTEGADHEAHHAAPTAEQDTPEVAQAPSADDTAAIPGMAGMMTPEMMQMMGAMMEGAGDDSSMAQAMMHCAMMQQMMSQGHEGAGHGAEAGASAATDSAWAQAYRAANQRMHAEMDIEFSDSADVDFARGMIGHHQGAIDMARVVLEHGEDPQLRQLAQDVINAQQDEVEFLENWLADRQH